jgi:hypothetical protein
LQFVETLLQIFEFYIFAESPAKLSENVALLIVANALQHHQAWYAQENFGFAALHLLFEAWVLRHQLFHVATEAYYLLSVGLV